MKHGYVKVAAVSPDVIVADVDANVKAICECIDKALLAGVKILVFPELAITGYSCRDLFFQELLLSKVRDGILSIAEYSKGKDMIIFVGAPLCMDGKLFNTAIAINYGKILGITTKSYLPNYNEFYEMRQFERGPQEADFITWNGESIPFGPQLLFRDMNMDSLVISAEICEDLWSPHPPTNLAARAGATVLVNCSGSTEAVGKRNYRRELIKVHSAALHAAYIYANAGEGESTTDVVYGGHNIIAEDGRLLVETKKIENGMIISEIDCHMLMTERIKHTSFEYPRGVKLISIPFFLETNDTELTKKIPKNPFLPEDKKDLWAHCDEVLSLQEMGLKKRMVHTHSKRILIGVSGGLDSTLALLVAARTCDRLEMDRSTILAITMPCFGTTDRTYQNACKMSKALGAELREISIAEAVTVHLRDIGHPLDVFDTTYENAQARERTQVLMDIANQENGMVVGTGDMSELALGWATYNGDHMSMYGVNCSIPKTLVRHLVKFYEENYAKGELKDILIDVLETPVSPELLPPTDGKISQKTEDLVGPYELHDFFLFYMQRYGFSPTKIYRLAKYSFEGKYEEEIILKWLKIFYRRFFSQQFKRSCSPDGPKVGTISLSPRGSLRMPSDASSAIWLKELEGLE